jgi:hypothetical protein
MTRGGSAAEQERIRRSMGNRLTKLRRAREDRLVHGGDRRIPGRTEPFEPVKERGRLETGHAGEAAAGVDRREDRADEAVNVKQRHDPEATVRSGQPQRFRDVRRGSVEIGMGQRHHLGARGRPRGVQDQGDITRLRGAARPGTRHIRAGQRERPGRLVDMRHQLNNPNPALMGNLARRRREPGRYNQRLRLDAVKIEVEFTGTIGGIERGADGRYRYREEACGHLGTVGEHDGDAITTPDTVALQYRGDALDLVLQSRIGHRLAVGGQQYRRSRCQPSAVPQQLTDTKFGRCRHPISLMITSDRHDTNGERRAPQLQSPADEGYTLWSGRRTWERGEASPARPAGSCRSMKSRTSGFGACPGLVEAAQRQGAHRFQPRVSPYREYIIFGQKAISSSLSVAA